MRRRLEFVGYFVFILYFLVKYGLGDDGIDRRPVQEVDPQIVRSGAAPSVPTTTQPVLVDVETKTGNASGTAFAFDGYGQYITARHVVDGCESVFLVTGKGKGRKAKRVSIEAGSDFAVLGETGLATPRVKISNQLPTQGSPGFMMGYPQGNPADVWAVAFGTTNMTSRGRYHITEPVFAWVEKKRVPNFRGALGGISGGPVFNEAGEVVGTVVAGSPRRGRVYTTHPNNFFAAKSLNKDTPPSARVNTSRLSPQNFHQAGEEWRQNLSIAQVYCKTAQGSKRRKLF